VQNRRTLEGEAYYEVAYQRAVDNDLATDVLAHLDPPALQPLLVELVELLAANPELAGHALMAPNEALLNALRLLGQQRPAEALAPLVQLAVAPPMEPPAQQPLPKLYMDNRTIPLRLVLEWTGQKPGDYDLVADPNQPGQMAFANVAAAAAGAARLHAWWALHHAEFAVAATAPAAPAVLPSKAVREAYAPAEADEETDPPK
jgi:hypothetical protein